MAVYRAETELWTQAHPSVSTYITANEYTESAEMLLRRALLVRELHNAGPTEDVSQDYAIFGIPEHFLCQSFLLRKVCQKSFKSRSDVRHVILLMDLWEKSSFAPRCGVQHCSRIYCVYIPINQDTLQDIQWVSSATTSVQCMYVRPCVCSERQV